MNDPRSPSALTIAGSDSGGGAGIQADLKTFAAHRVHGLSVIAALTAQHTRGVTAVHVPDAGFLRAQLEAVFEDFRIGAIKLGMLGTREVIEVVADALQQLVHHGGPWARIDAAAQAAHPAPIRRRAPSMARSASTAEPMSFRPAIVLDPVMIATSGAKLLADDALDALRTRLLPLADVLTPNIPEAQLLLGRAIQPGDDADDAARALHALTGAAILLKGAHLGEGDVVIDRYLDADGPRNIVHPRLPLEGHGTGCTLASAIAANLCLGMTPPEACASASDYVHRALLGSYRPGWGEVVVLDHFGAARDG